MDIPPPLSPLLQTKLNIPSRRSGAIPRLRLNDRLTSGLDTRLILVSAPAGFGKTTLLADWIYQLENSRFKVPGKPGGLAPIRFGWVSLDEGDNDPARFLAYLIAALQRLNPDAGRAALSLLRSPQGGLIEAALASLVNELATRKDNLALVLEDYHCITNPAVHAAVNFLIERLPDPARLVITTREDPPLHLARWRTRGQLTEIRSGDLAFRPEEAAKFLAGSMDLPLTPGESAVLTERVEGWAAGLQLAALAMRQIIDEGEQTTGEQVVKASPGLLSSFVHEFTGSNRYVIDYLAEEVLGGCDTQTREFLLETSILDRLCGPLCEVVTGGAGGQGRLEQLERANLFLIPLDGERRWYRYHPLFADFLQSRLLQEIGRQTAAELHRRAGEWLATQGLVSEAMEHYRAAGDYPGASSLIEENGGPMLLNGESHLLLRWLEALPEAQLALRPALNLLYAWALLFSNRLEAVEVRLQVVENALNQEGELIEGQPFILDGWRGQVYAVRGYLASLVGNSSLAADHSRRALAHLPANNWAMRGVIAMNAGIIIGGMGQFEEAAQILEEAKAAGESAGAKSIALSALAARTNLQKEQGKLRQALANASELKRLAGDEQPRLSAVARFYLGDLLREMDRQPEAAEELAQAFELAERIGDRELQALAALTAAQEKQGEGEQEDASLWRQRAVELVEATPFLKGLAAAALTRQALFRGDLPEAERWAGEIAWRPGNDLTLTPQDKSQALAVTELLIVQGRFTEAKRQVEQMEARAGDLNWILLQIEAGILHATLLQKQELNQEAQEVLAQALTLAEPQGYVRTFVEGGKSISLLLERFMRGERRLEDSNLRVENYAQRIMQAFRSGKTSQAAQPQLSNHQSPIPILFSLSDRELEVLRLIAAGASNREIAGKLFLSLGTVKAHIHHIFEKLDVQSRTQAAARARALGLLPPAE